MRSLRRAVDWVAYVKKGGFIIKLTHLQVFRCLSVQKNPCLVMYCSYPY